MNSPFAGHLQFFSIVCTRTIELCTKFWKLEAHVSTTRLLNSKHNSIVFCYDKRCWTQEQTETMLNGWKKGFIERGDKYLSQACIITTVVRSTIWHRQQGIQGFMKGSWLEMKTRWAWLQNRSRCEVRQTGGVADPGGGKTQQTAVTTTVFTHIEILNHIFAKL